MPGVHPSNDEREDYAENRDVDVLGLEERLSALGDGAGDGFQTIVGVGALAAVAGLELRCLGEGRLLTVGDGDIDCRIT